MFTWCESEEESFQTLKQKLCDAPVLSYFDKTCYQVIADASPYGLAAVLVQKQNGQNRIIAYASRTLSQIERKYSQTEKEALALLWSCERFHVYLYGPDFNLLTDHKALEFIFSPRSKPSARVERWMLRLQPYRYKVIHTAGSKNIADSLSRLFNENVIKNAENDDSIDEYANLIVKYAMPIALTTREIEKPSYADKELRNLRNCILSNDWLKLDCKSYLPVRISLTTIGFIVLRGTSIVIPSELREHVLKLAHRSSRNRNDEKEITK